MTDNEINEDEDEDEIQCSICLNIDKPIFLKTYQKYVDDNLAQLNTVMTSNEKCQCKLVYHTECLDHWSKIINIKRCPTCKYTYAKQNNQVVTVNRSMINLEHYENATKIVNYLLSCLDPFIHMLIRTKIKSKNPIVYFPQTTIVIMLCLIIAILIMCILIPYFLYLDLLRDIGDRSFYEILSNEYAKILLKINQIKYDNGFTFKMIFILGIVSIFYQTNELYKKINSMCF